MWELIVRFYPLAHRLADLHSLPYFSVDQIQWLPGWIERAEAVVTEELDRAAISDSWIIDGWGSWPCIERRLSLSDTIIFIDLPLWVHFWFAAERQISVARVDSELVTLKVATILV